MWVVMACPYSLSRPGGVQGQTLGLARSLRALGLTVTVLAPHDDYRPGTFLPSTSTGPDPLGPFASMSPARRNVPQMDGTFIVGQSMAVRANGSVAPLALSPGAVLRVAQFARRRSPDVIHIHEPLAPLVNYAYFLFSSVPLVGTFHRSGHSAWHRALGPMARWATGRLSVRCAVSAAAAETTGSDDVEVLFNGVEVKRFSDATPRLTEAPTVMFLGRHERRKGLELLLMAFREVPAPAVLWIAGEGPETRRLRNAFPSSPRVHWLGNLTEIEITRRLSGAHILCAPSLFGESFGVVLLEAMAARCVVVASALEGHRAACGGHAQLFPVGDRRALAGSLIAALDEAASPSAARMDALDRAFTYANDLSMARLADRYESIYASVGG
jgi:phosphatidyl-myo-inositol alpha-mannosyltransferase